MLLYPGQSWQNELSRERFAEADREREAERERAERRARVDAEAERRRHARAARVEPTTPAAEPPVRSEPPESPKRRTWRDLNPDEINRYALAESLRP